MKTYSKEINSVYLILKDEFPKHRTPVVELIEAQTKNPFKILITTILSARTKDGVTAEAVTRLFKYVNSPQDLLGLSQSNIEKLIFPVGFFREKARYLKTLPSVLNDLYNGTVPDTVEELVKLPGVGRKTANLVVAVAFNKPAVCVDIHVHRIFNRLGYLHSKTPLETEMILREHLPVTFWTTFNSYFVSFGQNRCSPVHPRCSGCPIIDYCSRCGVSCPA